MNDFNVFIKISLLWIINNICLGWNCCILNVVRYVFFVLVVEIIIFLVVFVFLSVFKFLSVFFCIEFGKIYCVFKYLFLEIFCINIFLLIIGW